MTEKLQNQLGVKGVKTVLQVGTMHGRRYVNCKVLTNLIITDLNDENPIETNKVFTREFIPVDHDQIPTSDIVSKWNHLESETSLVIDQTRKWLFCCSSLTRLVCWPPCKSRTYAPKHKERQC